MLIQLNNRFRIRTFDDDNLVLEESYLKKDDQLAWKTVGYYSRLDHIIEKLIHLGLNKVAVSGVKEIKRHIDDAVSEILECVEAKSVDS